MNLSLSEKDLENPDVLGAKLITLAEIVIRKHFYASSNEKDDLVSIGVLKALTLIDKGAWTKGKGSFLNYIYSGMRNDMHNYLYHQSRVVLMDEDADEGSTSDKYFEDEHCYIDYRVIELVCRDFKKSFGEGIKVLVIKEIEDMGFVIKGVDKGIYALSALQDDISERFGSEVLTDVVDRVVGVVLWKRKEYQEEN